MPASETVPSLDHVFGSISTRGLACQAVGDVEHALVLQAVVAAEEIAGRLSWPASEKSFVVPECGQPFLDGVALRDRFEIGVGHFVLRLDPRGHFLAIRGRRPRASDTDRQPSCHGSHRPDRRAWCADISGEYLRPRSIESDRQRTKADKRNSPHDVLLEWQSRSKAVGCVKRTRADAPFIEGTGASARLRLTHPTFLLFLERSRREFRFSLGLGFLL